ncbi:ribosomal protection-like ABC-F family protein [Kurthia senegalensis]|uniref:ribosomal protection-like ABC-F family protein n=1 Tax=Kurthia senegalensis TaxID=1033740 RepID=UPI0002889B0A|nr:ATP-binding cassette domain-containing protein [Kurthia senegalensis]
MTITIQNISFSYDQLEEPLFKNSTLHIDESWRLGLVARNGRGKTTFLKLLLNELSPHEGTIQTATPFMYFPQRVTDPTLLAFDALTESMPAERWKVEKELRLLHVDPALLWQPYERLSGGEQTKIRLAILFSEKERFLLLDEPTNHLDLDGRKMVAHYLQQKTGYIVVSHDDHFLEQVTDHIVAIERQQLYVYNSTLSVYRHEKALRDQVEIEQNKALSAEIGRLKQTAKEKRNWADEKEKPSGNDPFGNAIAKRMNKRAKAIETRVQSQIEEKEAMLNNVERVKALSMYPITSHRNPVMRFKEVTLSLDGTPLFAPLTFDVFQGERVALVGPNGSGKSTLLNCLYNGSFEGEITGEMLIPKNLSMSYLPQILQQKGTLQHYIEHTGIDFSLFLNQLRIFGFERDIFQIPIENMSSGQRKKVAFAKSLCEEAECYLWDEPLNYLDVYNHEQLKALCHTFHPTLLFVEHDENFIKEVATKIIYLKPTES